MVFRSFIAFIVIGLAMSACKQVTTKTDSLVEHSFQQGARYAWSKNNTMLEGYKGLNRNKLDTLIRATVDQLLQTQGMLKSEKEGVEVDFLVQYFAAVRPGTEVSKKARYYLYDPYGEPMNQDSVSQFGMSTGSTLPNVREYDDGVLIVDILDPESKQGIWRGKIKAEVDYAASDATRKKRIEKALKDVFKQFPKK